MKNIEHFIQIGLASDTEIKNWSERLVSNPVKPSGNDEIISDSKKIKVQSAPYLDAIGEVKRPDTLNYRTLKPEKDGLFCERIFGPVNDWMCSCGQSFGKEDFEGTEERFAPTNLLWSGIPASSGVANQNPQIPFGRLDFASQETQFPLSLESPESASSQKREADPLGSALPPASFSNLPGGLAAGGGEGRVAQPKPKGETTDHEKALRGEYPIKVCANCQVEVTTSRLRRYRMGYIQLACPVTHIWYLNSRPNLFSILLKMPTKYIKKIAYYKAYSPSRAYPEYISSLLSPGGDFFDNEWEYLHSWLSGKYSSIDSIAPWNNSRGELVGFAATKRNSKGNSKPPSGGFGAAKPTEGNLANPEALLAPILDLWGTSELTARDKADSSAEKPNYEKPRRGSTESRESSSGREAWSALPLKPIKYGQTYEELRGRREILCMPENPNWLLNTGAQGLLNQFNTKNWEKEAQCLEEALASGARKRFRPAEPSLTSSFQSAQVNFFGNDPVSLQALSSLEGTSLRDLRMSAFRSSDPQDPFLKPASDQKKRRKNNIRRLKVLKTFQKSGFWGALHESGNPLREPLREFGFSRVETFPEGELDSLEEVSSVRVSGGYAGDSPPLGAKGMPKPPARPLDASIIFSVLPVLPPDLRPIIQLGSSGLGSSGEKDTKVLGNMESPGSGDSQNLPGTRGDTRVEKPTEGKQREAPNPKKASPQLASSDVNDLYRRVLSRNNRLKYYLYETHFVEFLVRSEQQLVQLAVDALLENGKTTQVRHTGGQKRLYKSLSDRIGGKQGRFRMNLLGKRVDYSGRSVIVVGPHLNLLNCGLPYEMALELFQPFLIRYMLEVKIAKTIRSAKNILKTNKPIARQIAHHIIQGHPILLNRAPTLHRLGIQAFQPVLVLGRGIHLHPLVCPAFNADFDGDQMAVHIPLSPEARAEARLLMISTGNWLSSSTGQPNLLPSQDMVLGFYYVSLEKRDLGAKRISKLLGSLSGIRVLEGRSRPRREFRDSDLTYGLFFQNMNNALHSYHTGEIDLHSQIWVKINGSCVKSLLGNDSRRNPGHWGEADLRGTSTTSGSGALGASRNPEERQWNLGRSSLGAKRSSKETFFGDLPFRRLTKFSFQRRFQNITGDSTNRKNLVQEHKNLKLRLTSVAGNPLRAAEPLNPVGGAKPSSELTSVPPSVPPSGALAVGDSYFSDSPKVEKSVAAENSIDSKEVSEIPEVGDPVAAIFPLAPSGGDYNKIRNLKGSPSEQPIEIRLNKNGRISKIYSSYQWQEDTEKNIMNSYIRTTPGRILLNDIICKYL